MDPEKSTVPVPASAALLAAVLLLSASGLMFEVTLTRIFSATIWYHYTFVAVSVALFGWGLGGFLVWILGLMGFRKDRGGLLVVLSLLVAIALPLFLYGILQFPFVPDRITFYFLLSVLPFLAGGAALSLAFEAYARDVNRLYFADLVGAALGTLLVPLTIARLGAETTILATALLPATAAVLLALRLRTGHRPAWVALAVAVLVGSVGFTLWNSRTETLTIRDAPCKALYKLLRACPKAVIDTDRWNAYSRITSVSGFDDIHVARLFIDSDAETSVLRWNGRRDGLEGRRWFRAFPFRLAAAPKVLVIGPGGGTDVVLSIVTGASSVTAVEMNPLIVDRVRELGSSCGNLYDHANVHLVMDEGRNFIRRTGDRFDLIVLGFVDSWASVASGGLSLTENYLYTREAMEAYYDHLTDRGALVVIRWPVDVPQLVANSVELLSARGLTVDQIGRHVLAVCDRKPQGTEPVETVFMLSRCPLTKSTVDRLLEGHRQAHVIYAPSRASEMPYAGLFSGRITFDEFADSFATLARPVRDDRPFFFARDKPLGIPAFALRLLRIPVALVIGFMILLLAAGRVGRFRVPGGRAVAYFAALGVGFIVCEVALIQRLILLLGHPIYTLVVILFTLLLAGGLGSLSARRVSSDQIRRALGWIIPGVVVLAVLAAFALPAVVRAAIPLDLSLRIVVAGLLVFPFGFLMGMPFPLGLRKWSQEGRGPAVSALWGINAVASVVGSIAGMIVAVAAGFTWMFLASALCYAVAWAARPR